MINESNIPQIVGLRYYNVFGPLEHNKGKMASTIYQFYQQIKKDKKIKIFKNSNNYRRDFISVEDVVNVNLHFLRIYQAYIIVALVRKEVFMIL